MGRPKRHPYPNYMTVDGRGFIVRNPLNGRRKRFTDEAEAREAAELLGRLVEIERRRKILDVGRPTLASLVEAWKRDRLPLMPWDTRTKQEYTWRLDRIARKIGQRPIERTDCLFLEDWLGFCRSADQFNKWRHTLVLLWRYAVSRKLAATNEAEKLEARSTSKKLAANRKVRQPLDIDGFRAIHAEAEPWLKLAMEQSLVTLQARTEICNMRLEDYRGGYLFVIRDKVSGDSDMAFIKIRVTDELEDLRRRSLTLDDAVSPYLVHRKPRRRRRSWIQGKPHWTHVEPGYLSKAFQAARDATKRWDELEPRQRPTFHEIRGLGARIYRQRGVEEAAIQALMTHAHKRTTRIYLEHGAEALSDDDYVAVTAPLRLREILAPR